MTKKVLIAAMVLVIGLTVLAQACAKPAGTETITLKMVTGFPVNNAANIVGVQAFKEKVERISNGALKIDFLGGPEVMSPFEQGSAIKNGAIDISYVFSAAYAGLVPIVLVMPVSPLTGAEERQSGFFKLMSDEHDKAGLVYLGRGAIADPSHRFFYIWTRNQVTRPEQLAGVKIGAPSPASNSFLKKLGALPVLIEDWAEFYVGIESRVIDGTWFTVPDFTDLKLHELPLFMIDHPYFNDNTTYIMNPAAYNKLPQNLKDALSQAVRELETEGPLMYDAEVQKQRKVMLDAKVKVVKFSDADAQRFVQTAYDAEREEQLGRLGDLGARALELLKK